MFRCAPWSKPSHESNIWKGNVFVLIYFVLTVKKVTARLGNKGINQSQGLKNQQYNL